MLPIWLLPVLPFCGLKLNKQLEKHCYEGTVDTVGVCVVREMVLSILPIPCETRLDGPTLAFSQWEWRYWLNKRFWLARLKEGKVRFTLQFCWVCFQRTDFTKSLKSFGIVGILGHLESWHFVSHQASLEWHSECGSTVVTITKWSCSSEKSRTLGWERRV